MTFLPKITGVGAITGIQGDLDAALQEEDETRRRGEEEKRIKTLAASPPRNTMLSPFDVAPHVQPARQFSISLTPSVRGITINTAHPLESTVEEVGGRLTISFKW